MKKLIYTLSAIGLLAFSFGIGASFAQAQTCSFISQTNTYACTPAAQPLPNGCQGATGLDGMNCSSIPTGYTAGGSLAFATFFSATPTTINRGETVSLAWQTQNATGCSIEGEGANKSVNTSGTLAVQPQQSTTFVLSCRDASAGSLSGELRALSSVSVTVTAYSATPTTETRSSNITYVPLEPFPGLEGAQSGTGNFGELIQGFFRLLVNIGAFVAVTVLVIGGITYMISEATVTKFVAKEKIKAAFWGLAIIAGAWLVLNTINPQLLTFNENLLKPSPSFVTTTTQTLGATGFQEYALSNKEYDLLAQAIGCDEAYGQRAGCLTENVLIYNPNVAPTQTFQTKQNEFAQACSRLPGFRMDTKLGQVIGSVGTEIKFCARPSQ